jgi:multidrug transporter EmrE-like cation transporter
MIFSRGARLMPYLFILTTVLLTVYGQFVVKWQVMSAGAMPEDTSGRLTFLVSVAFNPWVISAYLAAFLASLTWMLAVRQLDLSYAYPFTSLSFVLVVLLSPVIFRESLTLPKVIGLALIVTGIIVGSRG